jgi:hypothetical protein
MYSTKDDFNWTVLRGNKPGEDKEYKLKGLSQKIRNVRKSYQSKALDEDMLLIFFNFHLHF